MTPERSGSAAVEPAPPPGAVIPTPRRETSLDALRGLAALQVVLLHFFSAFFPGLVFVSTTDTGLSAWLARSPLACLWDGTTAVCLFFLLSGYVLTRSFAGRASIVAHVTSRWVRLVVPAFASCVFAAMLLRIFGHANISAAAVMHNSWLDPLMRIRDRRLPYFLKDALLSSWLIGYVPNGPGASLGFSVHHLGDAYNAVLWTLSVEFFGSMIVLTLSRLRGQTWWTVAMISGLFFFRSFYWLFIAGHVLAAKGGSWKGRLSMSATIVLIVVGLWLSHTLNTPMMDWLKGLNSAAPDWFFPDTQNSSNKPWGALLIFIALLGSRPLTAALASSRLRLLGELSFAIYLVHFPILLTLASKTLVAANPTIGPTPARYLALVVGLIATFIAACLFRSIDRLSVNWSRTIRGRTDRARAGITV
jgi:peptidoglycan/LPS O-acetylase OafA/YrhL